MEGEWEQEKERILNSLLGAGQELELPTEAEVLQATPLSMHGRSALDAVAMAYAREVYVRNEAKLQGLSHSLVTAFHSASTNFVDKVRWQRFYLCKILYLCVIVSLQNIADCWSLLKTIVDVPRLPPAAYNHRSSPSMQKAFVMQARHVLETRWVGEKEEEGEKLKVASFSGAWI